MRDSGEELGGTGAFLQRRIVALCEVAAALLIVFSGATLFASMFDLADILTSFRHLFVIAALPVVLVLAVAGRRVLAGLTALTLLGNFVMVAHAFGLAGDRCEANLTVVTLNALGPDNDVAATLRVLRDAGADIVVVTELGGRLDAALQRQYLHQLSFPHEGVGGMGIFSRFPLKRPERQPGAWFPQLTAVVATPGTDLMLVAAHPPPPLVDNSTMLRNMEIVDIANRVAEMPRPVIVAGDLNLTRQSPNFQPLLGAGLVDSRVGQGIEGTWPAKSPFRVGIDHILHTSDITTCDLSTGRQIGSDHLPLVAKLRL